MIGSVTLSDYLNLAFSTFSFLVIRILKTRLSCSFALTLYTGHVLAAWVVLELFAMFGRLKRSDPIPFRRRLLFAVESAVCGLATFANFAENPILVSQLWQLCSVLKFQNLSIRRIVPLAAVASGLSLLVLTSSPTLYGVFAGFLSAALGIHIRKSTDQINREFSVEPLDFQLSIIPEVFAVGLIASTFFENFAGKPFILSEFYVLDLLFVMAAIGFGVAALISNLKVSSELAELSQLAKSACGVAAGLAVVVAAGRVRSPTLGSVLGIGLGFGGALGSLRLRQKPRGSDDVLPLPASGHA
jgi:hypothetical protein